MGIDAQIYFKLKDGKNLPDDLAFDLGLSGDYSKIKEYNRFDDDYPNFNPTHEVYTLMRYYGQGYERGPWRIIGGILMALHACEDVEKVWYDGDCGDTYEECPPERVLEISKHYMENGERPYRRG